MSNRPRNVQSKSQYLIDKGVVWVVVGFFIASEVQFIIQNMVEGF